MTRIKTIQCITAAAVLVFGSFAASAAYAHKSHHGKRHKHKKKHRYHDDDHGYFDDDHSYFDDDHGFYDDDDYRKRRRKRRHRSYYDDDHGFFDDDGYGRRGRRGRHGHHRGYHDDDGYGHMLTEIGVDELRFFDLGQRLGAELQIAGAGEQTPVELRIEATADVQTQCRAPGQITRVQPERVDLTTEGVHAVERVAGDPATIPATIQTADAGPLAKDLGACADTLRVDQVQFLDARVDLNQGDATLTLLCTFLTPTNDGPIAAREFECVAL